MYSGRGRDGKSMQSLQARRITNVHAWLRGTGGKALLDVNSLGRGILTCARSPFQLLIIGYYTTNSALDGKFAA